MTLGNGVRLPVKPPVRPLRPTPPPGRRALVTAAVVLGALMLALQLWLLAVALELYLAGDGDMIWQLAVVSGIFFAFGVAAVLVTRPRLP